MVNYFNSLLVNYYYFCLGIVLGVDGRSHLSFQQGLFCICGLFWPWICKIGSVEFFFSKIGKSLWGRTTLRSRPPPNRFHFFFFEKAMSWRSKPVSARLKLKSLVWRPVSLLVFFFIVMFWVLKLFITHVPVTAMHHELCRCMGARCSSTRWRSWRAGPRRWRWRRCGSVIGYWVQEAAKSGKRGLAAYSVGGLWESAFMWRMSACKEILAGAIAIWVQQ